MIGKPIPDLQAHAADTGVYRCSRCRALLFAASRQFHAGCGFPSFWAHEETGVTLRELHTYGRTRTQLLCRGCGLHLGHLFPHPHTPTQRRYCINAGSICYSPT